ncbi:MAG: hypothetical protein IJ371_03415 [Clostridia bacterium]|nr:hypothetical protein [Clostridia bacterium]
MEQHEMKRTLIWDDASNAFNWYAESLCSDIDVEKYLDGKWINLDSERGIDLEIELQAVICRYLGEEIDSLIPDFTQVAKSYRKSIAKIPAELSVQEFKDLITKKEDKLKTIGKLQYCIDRINSHAKMYELIVANYLMMIYYKLSGLVIGQKHKNPTATFRVTKKSQRLQNLRENRIYAYLFDATLEYFDGCRNLSELFSYPIKELVDNLFRQMVLFEYNLDKTVIEPWVGINNDGDYEEAYSEMFVLDGEMDSEQEALAYAEHNFNLWLIDQMHTLENGMKF